MNNELEIEFRSISVGTICPICQKKIRRSIVRGFSKQTHRRTNSNHLLGMWAETNSSPRGWGACHSPADW